MIQAEIQGAILFEENGLVTKQGHVYIFLEGDKSRLTPIKGKLVENDETTFTIRHKAKNVEELNQWMQDLLLLEYTVLGVDLKEVD